MFDEGRPTTAVELCRATSTQDVLPQGAEEFSYFSNLPVELRLKIWRSAFPGQRKVFIGVQYTRRRNRKCLKNVDILPTSLTNHERKSQRDSDTLLCLLAIRCSVVYPGPLSPCGRSLEETNSSLHQPVKRHSYLRIS
jgi:hypothetical protein